MKVTFCRLLLLAAALSTSLCGCNSAHGIAGDSSYPMPKQFVSRWNALVNDSSLTIEQAADPEHNILNVVLTDSTNQRLVLDLGDVTKTKTGILYNPDDMSYTLFCLKKRDKMRRCWL